MEGQECYEMVPVSQSAMPVTEILEQVELIQNVMRSVMRDNEHYGVIPGTGNKPSLLKPGAEKLNMTFRMAPKYDIEAKDFNNGHREYEIVCNLFSLLTGQFLGSGVGNCSTMESKYRFRTGPVEFTGKPVPKEYWDLRKTDPSKALQMIGGRGYATKKNDTGTWEIVIQGEKVEHDNPADYYNTVKKMAKKRALVDAVLTVTAASDIFTQDIEDLHENGVMGGEKKAGKPPVTPPARASEKKSEPTPTNGDLKSKLETAIKEHAELSGLFDADIIRQFTTFTGKDGSVKCAEDLTHLLKSEKWAQSTLGKIRDDIKALKEARGITE